MTTAEQRKRAELLLGNTKRLRFFKGQAYDGGADEYLRQLHSFLSDFLASPSPSVTEEEIIEALEPFAEIAKELLPALKDDDKNSMAWAVPKVGDIRRAARILRLIRG